MATGHHGSAAPWLMRVLFGVVQGDTVVDANAARAFADGPCIDEAVEGARQPEARASRYARSEMSLQSRIMFRKSM